MAFKMKGLPMVEGTKTHKQAVTNLQRQGYNNMPDGRSPSSPFQHGAEEAGGLEHNHPHSKPERKTDKTKWGDWEKIGEETTDEGTTTKYERKGKISYVDRWNEMSDEERNKWKDKGGFRGWKEDAKQYKGDRTRTETKDEFVGVPPPPTVPPPAVPPPPPPTVPPPEVPPPPIETPPPGDDDPKRRRLQWLRDIDLSIPKGTGTFKGSRLKTGRLVGGRGSKRQVEGRRSLLPWHWGGDRVKKIKTTKKSLGDRWKSFKWKMRGSNPYGY